MLLFWIFQPSHSRKQDLTRVGNAFVSCCYIFVLGIISIILHTNDAKVITYGMANTRGEMEVFPPIF